MFVPVSFLLSALYVFLMTYFVSSAWYFIILWVVTGIIIFYLLTIIFLILIIEIIFPRLSYDSKIKYMYIREMGWWITTFLLIARVKIVGKENLPKDGKLTVYGNHKSKLDPLYISQAISRPHGYAAKSELSKFIIVRTLLESMNSFYVYREDNRKTLRELMKGIDRAKEGHCFLIFPEGGTMYREHEDIREVRSGAYKLAQKAKTDIMPVTMLGTNQWAKRKFYLWPIKVKIILHPVIKYEDYQDLTTNEIADKVTAIINSVIE